MEINLLDETRAVIATNFELETKRPIETEAELLAELSSQIEWLMERRTEFLFSLLYRHDVEEKSIVAALDPSAAEPPSIGLARLVLERQKQRVLSKKTIKSPDSELLKEFNW